MRNFQVIVGYGADVNDPNKQVTSFRAWLDSTMVAEAAASGISGGQITLSCSSAPGTYTLQVSAVGPGGETASDGQPIALPLFPPDKPIIVQVIVA